MCPFVYQWNLITIETSCNFETDLIIKRKIQTGSQCNNVDLIERLYYMHTSIFTTTGNTTHMPKKSYQNICNEHI